MAAHERQPRITETTDFGFRRVPRAAKARHGARGVRQRGAALRPDERPDVARRPSGVEAHFRRRRSIRGRSARCWTLPAAPAISGFGWLAQGGGPVLLTDINASMLEVARDRALDRGADRRCCRLLVADAERLPLPDRAVDRVSIAFGLRNCTDKAAVLAEARRVLKPGGRFFCLEFSRVQVAALQPLYDAWSFRVLPRLGRWVARDEESYRYLAESIRTFPDQETLAGMMRDAGFARVAVRNLSGGIAAIHSGWRL